jgi:estrogen-related receptor beta like 1
MQDEFARISEQYREVSGGVTDRSRILAHVTEELESVKQEMDERGSSMTDGSKSHEDIISALWCSKLNISVK